MQSECRIVFTFSFRSDSWRRPPGVWPIYQSSSRARCCGPHFRCISTLAAADVAMALARCAGSLHGNGGRGCALPPDDNLSAQAGQLISDPPPCCPRPVPVHIWGNEDDVHKASGFWFDGVPRLCLRNCDQKKLSPPYIYSTLNNLRPPPRYERTKTKIKRQAF